MYRKSGERELYACGSEARSHPLQKHGISMPPPHVSPLEYGLIAILERVSDVAWRSFEGLQSVAEWTELLHKSL